MDDEYEIIPTSPLRRLEKRLSRIEETNSASEIRKLIDQIIELIKVNQRVIDDVVKSDAELRNEISKIPGRIEEMTSSLKELIEMIKASAAEEASSGASKEVIAPLVEKMDELIQQNRASLDANKAILSNLAMIDNRLKRLYSHAAMSMR